jgi:two-component system, OmpR family, phosphate regulon response regulator PhoB
VERDKVLIIESDDSQREAITKILSKHYEVITASTKEQAISLAKSTCPKVLIIDPSISGGAGGELCSAFRNDPTLHGSRFIILSALNDAKQRAAAFLAGADDYIQRPVDAEELLARVFSKVRRLHEQSYQTERVFGNAKINSGKMLSINGGTPKKIGLTELKILNFLVNALGKTVTRKDLAAAVWGDASDHVLDPHITSLRKKLAGSNVEIKTLYGEGYSLVIKRS